MFKRTMKFETSFDNSKYIEEFMNEYAIKRDVRVVHNGLEYTIEMLNRHFNAFCNYLFDLGKFGVYPIRL